MTCERMQPLISSYIDGALDREDAERVRRHVAACPHCVQALRAYRAVQLLLSRKARPAPDPYLWPRLRARIEAAPSPWAEWIWVARRLVVALAAVVVLILALFTRETLLGRDTQALHGFLSPEWVPEDKETAVIADPSLSAGDVLVMLVKEE